MVLPKSERSVRVKDNLFDNEITMISERYLRDLKAKESQCIVGEGALPIPAIFRALDDIRYPGFVNLEYEIDAADPLPGMKQSFAYMRGVLAGMAPARNVAAPARR